MGNPDVIKNEVFIIDKTNNGEKSSSTNELIDDGEHSSNTKPDDEVKHRGNWANKLDFLLSCIGFAVGLGNVWRFPYLCYRNGGGAFLIPYVIMLAFVGLPLFLMELCIGQYASLGCITVWKISPLFKGLGYAMIIISVLVSIYYNVIIAYTLHFLFASFTSQVPWQTCNNTWNTDNCVERSVNKNVTWCSNKREETNGCVNVTHNINAKTPSQEYFERAVLDLSTGIEQLGYPKWQLVLLLFLAWVVIFFCLFKGVKSSGKVVYFTATFPYVVLVALLIRGATLDGALNGVLFYITPQWDKLTEAKVWGDAAVQIFYSLGPAWGGLITMASYNKFNNNCYRDAIIVAVTNCATSVFAGFVIFCMLGYMSHYTGLPIDNVTTSGPGLAFVAYPEGIANMPLAPLWSVLFFFMIFTLGLDSQFVMCETFLSGIEDEWPHVMRGNKKKCITVGCFSFIMFLLGIPLCCPGGIYYLTLMDWYAAGFSLMVISLFEIAVVMWIYGFQRFLGDIKMMIGFRLNYYWIACWVFITPATIAFIIIFSAVEYSPATYGNYVYPPWAEVLGWLMVFASLTSIPLMAGIKLFQFAKLHGGPCNFATVLRQVTKPTSEWGPAMTNRPIDAVIGEHVEAKRNGAYENTGMSYSCDTMNHTNGNI